MITINITTEQARIIRVVASPTSPFFWLDKEDVINLENLSGEDRRSYLSVIFGDYTVSRPTQVLACSSGYQSALESSGMLKPLTKRQRQALKIAFDSAKTGKTDIHFRVGHELGISTSAATKLLQRAHERLELQAFMEETPSSYYDDVLLPAEEDRVSRWMRNHPRPCAGSGREATEVYRNGQLLTIPACTGTAHNNYGLCYPCHTFYGVPGEWDEWLVQRESDIQKEHRQMAITELQSVDYEYTSTHRLIDDDHY